MDRNVLVPVMAVAIVNGIFSPFVLMVFLLYPVWFPSWAPAYAQLVYMLSALILSTLTIMLAGVPAALYERLAAPARPAAVALIWLAGVVLLTLPAVPGGTRSHREECSCPPTLPRRSRSPGSANSTATGPCSTAST